MAITLPMVQKDAFGGPAGSTRQAMATLVEGILQGAAKRRKAQQNQELSTMFSSQSGAFGPPRSPEMFVENLLSNPNLTQESKGFGLNVANTMSAMDLRRAQAEKARTPTREPSKIIEYWKPDGSYGSKVSVPESRYNETVNKLEGAGYTVNKPTAGTGEFERFLSQLEKSKRINEEQKLNLIEARVKKIVESGGDDDETNKIKGGDGKTYTLAELRGFYKDEYNIPDKFELQIMSYSADPLVQQQAAKLKAKAATAPSLSEFIADVRENGLPGVRRGPKTPKPNVTPANVPPLPSGFELD